MANKRLLNRDGRLDAGVRLVIFQGEILVAKIEDIRHGGIHLHHRQGEMAIATFPLVGGYDDLLESLRVEPAWINTRGDNISLR